MRTIVVQYTEPGLIHLRSKNSTVRFRRGNEAYDMRLNLAISIGEAVPAQAAEDFYVPIFLNTTVDTIRGYFDGMNQAVTVFDAELRPFFKGSAELLGKKREEFAKTLDFFRQQIRQTLAMLQ